MNKSKAELAKQPPAGAELEAPIRLTPDQLESVVAGAKTQLILESGTINPTTTMGIIAPPPTWPFKVATFSTRA
jgi:hypothetical protein